MCRAIICTPPISSLEDPEVLLGTFQITNIRFCFNACTVVPLGQMMPPFQHGMVAGQAVANPADFVHRCPCHVDFGMAQASSNGGMLKARSKLCLSPEWF